MTSAPGHDSPSSWTARTELLSDGATPMHGATQRVTLHEGARQLGFAEVVDLLENDDLFRTEFNGLLAAAPFDACFWETPPITLDTLDRPFECVLVDAPALAGVVPDPLPFAEQLVGPDVSRGVATFLSLGRDALLVAPSPAGEAVAYAHLLAFARSAPVLQQHALWRAVGVAVGERLGEAPLWLSTSGLGVAWLHVRLDSWPKYYTHGPYRDAR